MLTFLDFIQEGNKLRKKIVEPLSKGQDVGIVSSERGGMSRGQKRTADKKLSGDLERLRKSGAISKHAPAGGRYQYDDPKPGESGVAKEKSHVVSASSDPKKAKHFGKIMKGLRSRYGQETTAQISAKSKEMKYHHAGGKETPEGKLRLNKKMTTGSGETRVKGGSFTTEK